MALYTYIYDENVVEDIRLLTSSIKSTRSSSIAKTNKTPTMSNIQDKQKLYNSPTDTPITTINEIQDISNHRFIDLSYDLNEEEVNIITIDVCCKSITKINTMTNGTHQRH
jgi:hypothetical protein